MIDLKVVDKVKAKILTDRDQTYKNLRLARILMIIGACGCIICSIITPDILIARFESIFGWALFIGLMFENRMLSKWAHKNSAEIEAVYITLAGHANEYLKDEKKENEDGNKLS